MQLQCKVKTTAITCNHKVFVPLNCDKPVTTPKGDFFATKSDAFF